VTKNGNKKQERSAIVDCD